MVRFDDFDQPEYGREPTWEAMEERLGSRIDRDDELQNLFDQLLPHHDDYPTGGRDEVEFYLDDVMGRINDYLHEEYGEEYDIEEFFDWGDWRENYDAA
jgi:hypothetical protein